MGDKKFDDAKEDSLDGGIMEVKNLSFEVKGTSDDGTFEGYASVFGVKDSGGDVVERGAFAKSIKSKKLKQTKILWQHNWDAPIGIPIEMREDEHGLFVKGKLSLGVRKAKEAYELMKDGVIDVMSIGYVPTIKEYDDNTDTRYLKEIDLWEFSPVTFAMNKYASINSVKDALLRNPGIVKEFREAESVRKIESLFKKIGLSNSLSEFLANRYKVDGKCQGEPDSCHTCECQGEPDDSTELDKLLVMMNKITIGG